MKKTGYEIIGMIKDGKAPKKIKSVVTKTIYDWKEDYFEYNNGYNCIELLYNLDSEFEIIEDSKVWKPKEDEEYYYIQNAEEVGYEYYTAEYDKLMYEIGNCFKTPEEAEKTREKIKIYTQLKRYAEEHNSEKIDWNKNYQIKYYIQYDYRYNVVNINNTTKYRDIGKIYFIGENTVKQAIKEIGEDNIIKLFED